MGESDTFCEHRRDAAVLVGEVDASHPAAELAGDAARGPAHTAPDVEDMLPRVETCDASQLEGRFSAPNVKLVDGGEVLRLEVVEALARAVRIKRPRSDLV